jgi:2',3'-cyclic-nucleotide 2'-phosphodiesterase (5'-nucleotidase family)
MSILNRTQRRPALFAAVAGLVLALGIATGAYAAGGKVTILATASSMGEVITCGCSKKMLGGLDKRPSVIKAEQAKGTPVLVVDAGNFGDDKDVDSWKRTEFIWGLMGRMGYEAITPGDMEMIEGLAALKALAGRYPQVKWVSANVKDSAGAHVFPQYAIFDKGGVRVGVTGVTGASYYTFNKARGVQKKDDFTLEDSKTALLRVLPEMRRQCDVVVVLLHEGPGDAKRMAAEVPGIDVLVVGHSPGYQFVPDRVGETVLVRAGNRGQYMMALDVTVGGDGSVVEIKGEGKPLGEAVPKDPAFAPEVAAWEAKHPKKK